MIKSLEKSQAHHAKRNINYKCGGKLRQKDTNTETRRSEWPLSTKILHLGAQPMGFTEVPHPGRSSWQQVTDNCMAQSRSWSD